MSDYAIRCARCGWMASGPEEALPFVARRAQQHLSECAPGTTARRSERDAGTTISANTGRTGVCPGSLIIRADGTIAGCTEDVESVGCRGRDHHHDGRPIQVWPLEG